VIATSWGVATDVGLVRAHNEDASFAQFPVFVVADGMGGHAAGEVASGLASREFGDLAGHEVLTIDEISQAIKRANEAIVAAAGTAQELEGMGTTLVGISLVKDREQDLWLVFNLGDSRLYRMFEGDLELVTTDHSEVQELVDEGVISTSDARHHAHRNVITRALGIENSVEPDFWLLSPVPGERFLLCSDGLTSEVEDQDIADLLRSESEASVAATRLVEQAVARGGRDNVTVVVVDVLPDGEAGDVDTAERIGMPVTKVPFAAADPAPSPEASADLIESVPAFATRSEAIDGG
jgi:serine/threonine protein phosphatase PrpC